MNRKMLLSEAVSIYFDFFGVVRSVIRTNILQKLITTGVLISALLLWLIPAPNLVPCQRILCILCLQPLCGLDTSLIICSEWERLLALNVHLEGLCQATGHDASRRSAPPGVSVCHRLAVCVILLLCMHVCIFAYTWGGWVCTMYVCVKYAASRH